MQIDHDPNEPSHRTLIIMSVIAGVITIGALLVVKYGLEGVVSYIPFPAQVLFCGIVFGFVVGMRVGWWDCERYHSRTKGTDG